MNYHLNLLHSLKIIYMLMFQFKLSYIIIDYRVFTLLTEY